MKPRVLFVLALLAGCAEKKAAEPEPAQAAEPVATAPTTPEPTAAQLPIAADFDAEATQAITPVNYKAELATITKELENDEAALEAH
jgi:hypothetical protein